jgi:TRAP-type C4-dicarboxylate transport system permease small subunit
MEAFETTSVTWTVDMSKWVGIIDNGLEKIERLLAAMLYLLLIGIISVTVIARNLFHFSLHRLLELAPTVVLWLALVGATLALKHHRHIKIELLLRLLPKRTRLAAMVLTNLFAMTVTALLAWVAVPFVLNEAALFGRWGWVAVCFPVFFTIAFIRFFFDLLGIVQTGKDPGA